MDLFGQSNTYPQQPGFKKHGTSSDAARAIAPSAPKLRDVVLHAITASPGGLTPDEVAVRIGKPIWSVRPRCTELLRDGLVKDSGLKRRNDSLRMAVVLVAA